MRVLIRADASAAIGSGHWIRCRSLARVLQREGSEVRWCGRAPEGSFCQAIEQEFSLLLLPPGPENAINTANGSWLPISEAEDASLCQTSVESQGEWRPDWIVVDHYGLSSLWHQQIRAAWPAVRIAVIDDLADRAHDADLLIDHNTFACDLPTRYRHLLPLDREVNLCLGPQFALIDPFYAGFQGALPARHRLQRLLISLGGAGDAQLLEKILKALAALQIQGLQIQLVEGGFARESQRIQALCKQLSVRRFSALPSLAPLMATADAAIGAGGTTTWERLCLGLPSITYALAANQEEYSQVLDDRGLIKYLGRSDDFDELVFQQAVIRWQEEPDYLKRQSSQGMSLVDGQGCVRIARLMSAQVDTNRWSALTPQGLQTEPIWRWRDGLSLLAREHDQARPLRCLDRLEINRHCSKPPATYLRSQLEHGEMASEIRRVTLVSSRGSWMNHYIPLLAQEVLRCGCSLRWVHDHQQLVPGEVCFLLSYGQIVSEEWLALHRHNMVVHASALPQGKGWSPMSWQILEGASTIPLTLFEAAAALDAGAIHAQEMLQLRGHELAPEWQRLQAEATIRLCSRWLKDYPASAASAQPQQGEESFYRRRRPSDSCVDPLKSLEDQFSLLRVVDNESYPAFFERDGRRYRLRIEAWS
ncbi:UDP-2,4-diacetamido-2,4,6-trideoxy-beta-L-altropyranose hydrolase [Synechococcus sp. GEYO]|uniref:UDP-2,4-diacetamido-2,4, 6-trideoxy-beta-L-altropyranose hydrolase n=1 Tax=Synechococcus sp. GEYO TaxID=2575511 RepID=UPI000E0F2344|nr:UDP-2,4-diacetamido-2,4,6-trideoxy-beta-L-altropyranose hydrolase [Synechococcus sp. GEYO]